MMNTALDARESGRKTLLIADDMHMNRAMLARIFAASYTVLEAENGHAALRCLREHSDISAVILDIMMPEMDGFQVLEAMQSDRELSLIPVIVISAVDDEASQIKALNLGALDIIGKPFRPELVRHRVENIIARAEAIRNAEKARLYQEKMKMQEEQLFRSQHDMLTGTLNRAAFAMQAAELIAAKPANSYVISCTDVDGFKVVNDRFGHDAGDALLKYLANVQSESIAAVGGLTCRDMADIFVTLLPNDEAVLARISAGFAQSVKRYDLPMSITAHTGRYVADDPTLDVNLMIDRANMAMRSVKNKADVPVAYFSDEMRSKILREQELVDDMATALASGQFVLYFQPQCNYAQKRLAGVEALVRWQHPKKGLISPGEFIPLFEEKGLISALDHYVWEQACVCLKAWKARGYHPAPVSVNISRRDIHGGTLPDDIGALTAKYGIEPPLLHLEVTESAYVDRPQQVIDTVLELQRRGFVVEMDDFGSGYSSLNTLKDVPVDILKLDMKFVRESVNNARGGNILSSVVRMANWLKLPVIAEGVETRQQAEYLKSIGCSLMQGYYFAKPMPDQQYEQLLMRMDASAEWVEPLDTDVKGASVFLDASTQSTLLFNSFVGGAYIAEYDKSHLEMLRINDKFFDTLGCTRAEYAGMERDLFVRLYPESRALMQNALEEALRTGKETACKLHSYAVSAAHTDLWTMNRIRFLAQNVERYVFYVAVENITASVRQEESLRIENQRNRILIEQNNIAIFDYDYNSDTLHFEVVRRDKGPVKKDFPGYYDYIASSADVAPGAGEIVRDLIRTAAKAPTTGSFDYNADIWGDGYKRCRAHYTSIADDSGKVCRLVGQVSSLE